ncbi:MAG: efflux RND transporter periplasmic adaptor subunit [Candidatus Hydrogenedentota bacterium]
MNILSRFLLTTIALVGVANGGLDSKTIYAQHEDEHSGHDDEGGVIVLSESELEEFGIVLETVELGKLNVQVALPGEVRFNQDRLAHVVPRLSGVVTSVHKNLGDDVEKGEVMAVLDSRELASAKAMYLASVERKSLADALFERENDLREKKLSAEQDFLSAKQAQAGAAIEVRLAKNELRALGFSEAYIRQLPNQPDESLTRYEMLAPFDGTVVEKHIVLGEVLENSSEAFIIADLSSVWVDLSVYQKDLSLVQKGQQVTVAAGQNLHDAKGPITYIGPVIDEATRTALARVVLPNSDGLWRPGLFVKAHVNVAESSVDLMVRKSALQVIEDKISVFVKTEEGFEPRAVTVGSTDNTFVEITSGLVPGERVVTEGAFTLKAEMGKGSLGDGHNH